jgi:hypothetical protein
MVLCFSGICGVDSAGNPDADYLVECAKKEVQNDRSLQGVIFDFSRMTYQFGNRFSRIFDSNILKPNKTLFVRVIPKPEDIDNWKSLISECTLKTYEDILVDGVEAAIKMMNKEMNN